MFITNFPKERGERGGERRRRERQSIQSLSTTREKKKGYTYLNSAEEKGRK